MKTKARTRGGVEYEHDDGEVSGFAATPQLQEGITERGALAGVLVRLEQLLERAEDGQDQLRERVDELYRALNRTAGQLDGAERKIDDLVQAVGKVLDLVQDHRPLGDPSLEIWLDLLAVGIGRETP